MNEVLRYLRCYRFLMAVVLLLLGIDSVWALETRNDDRHPARKPNIIIILADDMGFADLECQGSKDISTPNIDSLASSGIRFTNGYVSCPVCSPSRAGLMTGRYQERFGHEFNQAPPIQPGVELGLPLTEVTLADRLKAAGYKTGVIGKWDLGMDAKRHPLNRGFDFFFGFLGGGHDYLNSQADPKNPILRGRTAVDEKEYLTDAFSREAVSFIRQSVSHADGTAKPFFLYLPYNAVHVRMQATSEYLSRFPNISDKTRQTYAAMLAALDDGVGVVLKTLRELHIEDDTLIFFLNDNGGPIWSNGSRNTPLKGLKAELWEGGIRVPFIIQWKGRLPAGKIYNYPVISLDVFPTAVTAAGGRITDADRLDGVDLMLYLTGENFPPHDVLYWRFGPDSAIRKGKWKLLEEGGEPARLFDLAADVGESHNLADKEPEIVKDLETQYQKWNSTLVKPLWGSPVRASGPRTKG